MPMLIERKAKTNNRLEKTIVPFLFKTDPPSSFPDAGKESWSDCRIFLFYTNWISFRAKRRFELDSNTKRILIRPGQILDESRRCKFGKPKRFHALCDPFQPLLLTPLSVRLKASKKTDKSIPIFENQFVFSIIQFEKKTQKSFSERLCSALISTDFCRYLSVRKPKISRCPLFALIPYHLTNVPDRAR